MTLGAINEVVSHIILPFYVITGNLSEEKHALCLLIHFSYN